MKKSFDVWYRCVVHIVLNVFLYFLFSIDGVEGNSFLVDKASSALYVTISNLFPMLKQTICMKGRERRVKKCTCIMYDST